jgi:hypothetical protein
MFYATIKYGSNNWEVSTSMVSVEDKGLRGGGGTLKQKIWDAARDVIQEWTGEELTPCSLYGIRVYHEGSILATHVDRLPLVSSAIINVAQDLDEPWYVFVRVLTFNRRLIFSKHKLVLSRTPLFYLATGLWRFTLMMDVLSM